MPGAENLTHDMSILAVGSIVYDTIKTPFVTGKDILGGSLTYFALAARFFAPVAMVGVVGQDFQKKDLNVLKKANISLSGLEAASGKTFRWSGQYSFDLNTRETLSTRLNVFRKFKPRIPDALKNSRHLFLGNISPRLQLSVLKQVRKPKLVVADTMNYWIAKARTSLIHVLKFVDILIINEAEVRQ